MVFNLFFDCDLCKEKKDCATCMFRPILEVKKDA